MLGKSLFLFPMPIALIFIGTFVYYCWKWCCNSNDSIDNVQNFTFVKNKNNQTNQNKSKPISGAEAHQKIVELFSAPIPAGVSTSMSGIPHNHPLVMKVDKKETKSVQLSSSDDILLAQNLDSKLTLNEKEKKENAKEKEEIDPLLYGDSSEDEGEDEDEDELLYEFIDDEDEDEDEGNDNNKSSSVQLMAELLKNNSHSNLQYDDYDIDADD